VGYETKCRVRVDDPSGATRRADDATVLIETEELIVRGVARVKIPRASITGITTRGATLTVAAPTATVALTLADAETALRWRRRLEAAPKALVDKLDVKPEMKVWLVGVNDTALVDQIRSRTANLSSGRTASACDAVFVQIDALAQLDRIARAAKAIVPNGFIWAVHPKGRPEVGDVAIFAAARTVGLISTKVARISDTLSAEKLVRPRAERR
jgi:hypothetical protein